MDGNDRTAGLFGSSGDVSIDGQERRVGFFGRSNDMSVDGHYRKARQGARGRGPAGALQGAGEHSVTGQPLAVAVVEALAADPAAIASLRALLATEQADPSPADPPAYTVDSLAATLKVSAKVIRNAIARGELPAVKRGRRWIIAGDAVRAWAAGAADGVPVRSRAASAGPLTTAVARLNGSQPRSTMPKP